MNSANHGNYGHHFASPARYRLQLAEPDAPQACVQLRHVNRTRDLSPLRDVSGTLGVHDGTNDKATALGTKH